MVEISPPGLGDTDHGHCQLKVAGESEIQIVDGDHASLDLVSLMTMMLQGMKELEARLDEIEQVKRETITKRPILF